MPTDATQRHWPRSTRGGLKVLAVGLLVALPILYVLSVGPATKLTEEGRISHDTFFICYAPVIRMTEGLPTANHVIARYLDAWGVSYILVTDSTGRPEVRWEYFGADVD